jgi:hypothetical protein
MITYGNGSSLRSKIANAISGLVFSLAIAVVVGGTAAMCLQRAAFMA